MDLSNAKMISECEIMPTGPHKSLGHGHFELSDPKGFIARSMEIAARWHGALLVDFDHKSEIRGLGNKKSVAAGWIVGLREDEGVGRIIARIRWTPLGAQAVADGLYRYISPTFGNDGKTVAFMTGAGLTNKPGLHMAPLIAPPAAKYCSGADLFSGLA